MAESSPDGQTYERKIVDLFGGQKQFEFIIPPTARNERGRQLRRPFCVRLLPRIHTDILKVFQRGTKIASPPTLFPVRKAPNLIAGRITTQRSRQAEIVAQHRSFIFATEQTARLQFRYHEVDELVQPDR
jgi:hypothetical protein